MIDWLVTNKNWLQYVFLGIVIISAILQFLLSKAEEHQIHREHQEMQASLTTISDHLEQLTKVEGLDRYLQPIKIEALRKYVAQKDIEELQNNLEKFSEYLNKKDSNKLKEAIKNILNIMPTDAFFRVYELLLKNRLIDKVFAGEYKVVQVVRWDWVVEGDEIAKLYVNTADEEGKEIAYGPFTNNNISMLDHPLNRFMQIKIESHGTGRFEWYPKTFRIGWAVAERKQDGTLVPLMGLSEYDPYFRLSLVGDLEF